MDSTRAPYDPVAAIYDRHWGYEFSVFARAAFDTQLLPLLPAGAAVLDLCCGTGLILEHLEELGFRTHGVDESANMLAIARRNAPRTQLQQADMAGFRWDSQFDAVVSFYNSLNHARSQDHLRGALVNVVKHLNDGGFLLFDYVLPEAFETAWEWREETDGDVRTLHYIYERTSGEATCLIDRTHAIRQITIQPNEMRDALCAAGMEIVSETPMTGSGPGAGRSLVLARKQ